MIALTSTFASRLNFSCRIVIITPVCASQDLDDFILVVWKQLYKVKDLLERPLPGVISYQTTTAEGGTSSRKL